MNEYYAVIFSSVRSKEHGDEYGMMAERMIELASEQSGFIGVESCRNDDGFGITVSYWESLEAIENWRNHSMHCEAKQRGKSSFCDEFKLRISKVISEREWVRE